MAIYHCSVQVIGRSTGRSVVAASAYRAGEKIESEYDGTVNDYTNKRWIEHSEIRLPVHAPQEYHDRRVLWNAVEMAEKTRDAQLAREVELALPVELNREQQIELVREYVDQNFVKVGMCADIAIHNPPLCDDRHRPLDKNGRPVKDVEKMIFRNPHAHILLTVRPISETGKWEAKSQKEYLCVRGTEEKGFTAEEFKIAKDSGWKKQYRYYTPDNEKIWLDSRAANYLELERVDRNPKCSKYGRKNPTVEYWNSKDRIEEWRKSWEVLCNDRLHGIDCEARIDARSYADQGRDILPTVHMGPNAVNMERRAVRELQEGKSEQEVVRSDIALLNESVRKCNRISERIQELQVAIKEKMEALYEKAKEIKARIKNGLTKLSVKKTAADREARVAESRINGVGRELGKLYKRNEPSYERIHAVLNKYSFDSMEDYKTFVQDVEMHIKESDLQIAHLQEEIDRQAVFLQSVTEVLPREPEAVTAKQKYREIALKK